MAHLVMMVIRMTYPIINASIIKLIRLWMSTVRLILSWMSNCKTHPVMNVSIGRLAQTLMSHF